MLYGVYALSQRCGELRKLGYEIKDKWGRDAGKRTHYKVYYMDVVTRRQEKPSVVPVKAHFRTIRNELTGHEICEVQENLFA